MNETGIMRKIASVGVGGNVLLVLFKLYAGIAGKSGAMVSDAVHSLSDVFATLIAFTGARISRKAPDREHPYGHERVESLASMLLGLILLGTGLGIGYAGVKTIIGRDAGTLGTPGLIALVAAVVSIVTKEAMFWYTRHYAKKLNSSVFMADAWHHRSDALSSVGSLIGIAGARLGFPIMDPIASVVICLFILKVGFDILKDAVQKVMDTSLGEEWDARMKAFILEDPGVRKIDLLQSRKFGDRIYLDVEIAVDGNLPLSEAHRIAERVHDRVEEKYPEIKHIMIHENPAEAETTEDR